MQYSDDGILFGTTESINRDSEILTSRCRGGITIAMEKSRFVNPHEESFTFLGVTHEPNGDMFIKGTDTRIGSSLSPSDIDWKLMVSSSIGSTPGGNPLRKYVVGSFTDNILNRLVIHRFSNHQYLTTGEVLDT